MIICLTYIADQVKQAEALIDFIHFLHGKKKAEAIVLVGGNDCHEEWRTKIRLSAEVAFLDVDIIYADPANLFGAAVERMDSYKESWIYLDPFCVPLIPRWLEAIEDAYVNQPKRILGPYLKDGDKIWLDRHAVYPSDLARFPKGDYTFFSTKTRIIQLGKYEKREEVRDKSKDDPAYLFCGDKTGELMKALRLEMNQKKIPNPNYSSVPTLDEPLVLQPLDGIVSEEILARARGARTETKK